MFEHTITDAIASDLRLLDELRERLDLRGTLSRRWAGRLRRELAARSIAASTSMEGVRVDAEDVRRLLVGDAPGDVTPEDAALVRGYCEAMEYVLKRADATSFAWEPELLLALQNSVMAHSWSRGAGRFREGPVRVVGPSGETKFQPPDADAAPALIRELTTWANEAVDVPAPIVSAMVHLGIAAIHPFRDGNGRTARVCAALAMYRGGFRAPEFTSLEEWWGTHLPAYYGAFECLGSSWSPAADVTPFIQAHVGAQRAQAQALALRQRVERRLWQALEEIADEELSGPTRWADALYDAFMCRPVSNRYYRGIADIEIAAASTDLAKMRTAGVLEAQGAGASRAYVGASRLYVLVASRIGVSDEIERAADADQSRDQILAALTEHIRAEDEFIAHDAVARYTPS